MLSCAVALLFFLQLLTAFVAASYSFGLLHDRLPPETAAVAFLLSPFLLALPVRHWFASPRALLFVVVVARLAYPLVEDTRAVMLLSGAGVSAALLWLPLLVKRRDSEASAGALAAGAALALGASIALRAIGSGVDASTMGLAQILAWPLAALALWRAHRTAAASPSSDARRASIRVPVLCVGIVASLTLLYFGLGAPSVISRWTGADYLVITALILGSLIGWCLLLQVALIRNLLAPSRLAAGTALFATLLVLSVVAHQVRFPSEAAEYPLAEPEAPPWSTAALALTLLLSPIIIVDIYVLASRLRALEPSARALGAGFGLGGVFLAAVIFAQIFTTTYDYVPVIGPAFRDKFWLVLAVPAVALVVSLAAAGSSTFSVLRPGRTLLASLGVVAVIALVGGSYVRARPEAQRPATSLTVVTYNVQQGYDADGQRNFDGQLALLRSLDADIIGLGESDTGRVAGGNDDLVRYLANGLDLYSYYGPKTVTGTFGIALLSRYPIEDPRTYYLFSKGEQTAVIVAGVTVEGRALHVMVTHLGNGGPMPQQEEVLSLAGEFADVVLMGDFNFRPGTQQYELTVQSLEDAWAKRWPTGTDAAGLSFPRRINHVFVSPGTDVRDATFVDTRDSNHPTLVVEIGW